MLYLLDRLPLPPLSGADDDAYEVEVGKIVDQIKASTTTRPLLDRIRDPRNHTAKTQILQLVQLAAKAGGGGIVLSLQELAEDVNTGPLVASALASAMGGAPWVAERNTKIADGVLDVNTLAADAARFCAILGDFGKYRKDGHTTLRPVAQKAFQQLANHGVFQNNDSSFWQGLRGLEPAKRPKFLEMARSYDVLKSSSLKPRDLMAGKLGASAEEAWDAMLQARPIESGDRTISSWEDLQPQIRDFATDLDLVRKVNGQRDAVKSAVTQLKEASDLDQVLTQLPSASTALGALRESAAGLPDLSAERAVWNEVEQHAQFLGVENPLSEPDNSRAETIKLIQQQTLEALAALSRLLPETRFSPGEILSNRPRPIQERLRYANSIMMQDVFLRHPNSVQLQVQNFLSLTNSVAELTP
jgi:hypothetical protein